MSEGNGIREISYFDCAGGGQVVVDGTYAYIGHITGPEGTTIVDVSDPARPRKVWERSVPDGQHSHKVRAANGVMLVNLEVDPATRKPDEAPVQGGLGIFDVSDPTSPKELPVWNCAGNGVH